MELLNPHERKALSAQLAADIDTAILGDRRPPSWRIGPSALDTDCDRKVWYGFRWVKYQERDARMRRLLDHGKATEPRFEEWLRGAGCTLWTIDPDAPPERKNKQFRVTAVSGHVAGFLDGIVLLPEKYNYPYPMVAEFKTSGTGAGFNKVVEKGVEIGKPSHAHQAGYYGWKKNFRYSVYMCLNKNDDSMHVEIIENDFNAAVMDELRMSTIIQSAMPPARVTENATDFRCKMCHFVAICHTGADYETNCRSCKYGEPIEGGEWRCNLVSKTIPRDFVPIGCGSWEPVGR